MNDKILKGFQNWMDSDLTAETSAIIDLVFEYLHDQNMLKDEGELLAHSFWNRYIKNSSGNELNENRKNAKKVSLTTSKPDNKGVVGLANKLNRRGVCESSGATHQKKESDGK
jgi:hypothetical protein